jgi:3-mercaptopyruvate sulfurtransferase SseA
METRWGDRRPLWGRACPDWRPLSGPLLDESFGIRIALRNAMRATRLIAGLLIATSALALHANGNDFGGANMRVGVDGLRRLEEGAAVLVLDVRLPDQYALGHVPGSMSVRTVREFEALRGNRRLTSRSAGAEAQTIVVYCNCLEEAASLRLVRELRSAGWPRVFALTGGIRAWVAAGGRLDSSPAARSVR